MSSDASSPFGVLVVEDQQRYRDLLVQEIKAMGYAAAGAASTEDAWDQLGEQDIQVVFLDLQLGDTHGMDLLRRIRESDRDVAVVILTAYGDMDSAVQALRWKADEYLSKPCSLSRIDAVLSRLHQTWLARQRAHRAAPGPPAEDSAPTEAKPPGARPLREIEREHILKALRDHDGNKSAAAKQLGISLRTLYNKLKSYREE